MVNDATPNVGDVITYTITLHNNGKDLATNVIVSETPLTWLDNVTFTPSFGSYDITTNVWSLASIAVNGTQTLTITGTVRDPNAQTNVVTITHSDQYDPDPNNNTSSATETPQQADVKLAKSVINPSPTVGTPLGYVITLSNLGPATATNVRVSEPLPSWLSSPTVTVTSGSYANSIWFVPRVEVGPQFAQTMTIIGVLNSFLPQTNTATIVGLTQVDPNLINNSASATEVPLIDNNAIEILLADAARPTYGFPDVAVPGGFLPQYPPVYSFIPSVPSGIQESGHVEEEGAFLSGHVYDDSNDNATMEVGERGIAGATIVVTKSGGGRRTTVTDARGFYAFMKLPPGTYKVIEIHPRGYVPTGESVGTVDGVVTGGDAGRGVIRDVVLHNGSIGLQYNFVELVQASLSGYVYYDDRMRYQREGDEEGVPGLRVRLTGTEDRGRAIDRTIATREDGSYDFPDLRPGTYAIQVDSMMGYMDGDAASGSEGGEAGPGSIQRIVVGAGAQGIRYDFGKIDVNVLQQTRRYFPEKGGLADSSFDRAPAMADASAAQQP